MPARERGYAGADGPEQLHGYQSRRASLTAQLCAPPTDAWQRPAELERTGTLTLTLTLEQLLTLALAHDAYHLRQVAEWLGRTK